MTVSDDHFAALVTAPAALLLQIIQPLHSAGYPTVQDKAFLLVEIKEKTIFVLLKRISQQPTATEQRQIGAAAIHHQSRGSPTQTTHLHRNRHINRKHLTICDAIGSLTS